MVVLGLVLLGGVGGGRDDRVDDVVDRDHVEDRVGQAGELGQQPAPVGHDQRVGDLEAVDPAGERMLQRALDDRGPHDRQAVAVLAPQLFGGALGERLGERVDVGPAERLGARASDIDELGAHPRHPGLLAGGGDRLRALLLVLGPRGIHEDPQLVGFARQLLDAFPRRLRGGVLGTPVDGVRQLRLGSDALAQAADVAGGDVHDARVALRGEQVLVQLQGAVDVGVEGLVDRRVERDDRGAVDDDVEILGELRDRAHLALDDADALLRGLLDGGIADLLAPGIERGLLEQHADAAGGVGPRLRAHQDRDGGLGVVGEQALQHGLPDETSRSGEKDVRATEVGRGSLRGHGTSLAETVGATDARPGSAATRSRMRAASAAPAGVPNTIASKNVRSSAARSTDADRPGRALDLLARQLARTG